MGTNPWCPVMVTGPYQKRVLLVTCRNISEEEYRICYSHCSTCGILINVTPNIFWMLTNSGSGCSSYLLVTNPRLTISSDTDSQKSSTLTLSHHNPGVVALCYLLEKKQDNNKYKCCTIMNDATSEGSRYPHMLLSSLVE